MKEIRPFLDLVWSNAKVDRQHAIFTIMKNGVRETWDNGQFITLTFKDAYDLLLALEPYQVSYDMHPDFWDTLSFRAREW